MCLEVKNAVYFIRCNDSFAFLAVEYDIKKRHMWLLFYLFKILNDTKNIKDLNKKILLTCS